MMAQGRIGLYGLLVAGLVLTLGSTAVAQNPVFHMTFSGWYGPMRDGSGNHLLPPGGGAVFLNTPWYLVDNDIPVGIADPGLANGSWKQFYHHYDEDPAETVVGWYFAHHQAIPGVVVVGAGQWTEYTEMNGIYTSAATNDGTYSDTFVIRPDPDDNTFSIGQTIRVRIPFRWRIPIVNPPTSWFVVSGCDNAWSLMNDPGEYTNVTGDANACIRAVRTAGQVELDAYSINIKDEIQQFPNHTFRRWSVKINEVESGYCPEDVFSKEGAWVEAYLDVETKIGEPFTLNVGPSGFEPMAKTAVLPLDSQYGTSCLAGSGLAVQLHEEPYAYELVGSGSIPPGAPLTTYARGCSNIQPYRLEGDANLDGAVDVIDLLILGGAFGKYLVPSFDAAGWPAEGDPNPYDVRADFNLDGVVDVIDLLTLQANFGCDPGVLPPQLSDAEWALILQ